MGAPSACRPLNPGIGGVRVAAASLRARMHGNERLRGGFAWTASNGRAGPAAAAAAAAAGGSSSRGNETARRHACDLPRGRAGRTALP